MKRLTVLLIALFSVGTISAQIDNDWSKKVKESQESARKEYENFRQQAMADYGDFRKKANEEYARFLEEAWVSFKASPEEEFPWNPKPIDPVVADSQTKPEDKPVDFNLKPIAPLPIKQPTPIEPIAPTIKPDAPATIVRFFGTEIPFNIEDYHPSPMKDISEHSIAKLWREFSQPAYDNLVSECLRNRSDSNLCDWAYVVLTEQVAEQLCGGHTNEAVVLHLFLLTQSGYQMRLGRAGNKLYVLVGSNEKIYHYKYFKINNVNYYLFDNSVKNEDFFICQHAYPKEKLMSLVAYQPKLSVVKSEPREIASKRYPKVKARVQVNRNLIDFFNSYPLSAQWIYYSRTSLSEVAKGSLYPVLRNAIKDKTEFEAANILLNFVQTGFSYATDQQQFGYERPLFPDESLYYPFNDCEDRSIFFACLVRELMGLDVVLLDYPEHLATAVCFSEDVAGSYLTIDGKRYVICDPTYIGADVGLCMPQYQGTSPYLKKFNN